MKPLLKKIALFSAFILAGILFQIGCSNADDTQTVPAASPAITIGKIVYVKRNTSGVQSIWVCDLDGANQAQVPITLPADRVFYKFSSSDEYAAARLSPNGEKIIFTATSVGGSTQTNYIYSCDIDGGNLQVLVATDSAEAIFVGNVI